jgi:hypothetical protein
MHKNEYITELWLLPMGELKTHQAIINDLVSLRERIEQPVEPSSKGVSSAMQVTSSSLPQQPSQGLRTLRERAPMRSPKPGSMRSLVHEILQSAAEPMPRGEMIAQVAAKRGVVADDMLKAKVGDLLNSRHDPYIRKVAKGIYCYVPQEVTSCL